MYAYTAASPIDGHIDYTIQPFLDSENVSKFLKYRSEQHRKEEILLVWDEQKNKPAIITKNNTKERRTGRI